MVASQLFATPPPLCRIAGFQQPGLQHGVFNRRGGVSPAPWNSLNLSHGVGDEPQNVWENRRRIKMVLGLDALASAHQVHGDRVREVRAEDLATGEDPEFAECDALITRQPGVGLLIQQADCQAVLLHDPVQGAVGIAHVGWRGSVAGIIGRTVATMTERFGTDPGRLRAAISPSLGPCCAEFVNHARELPAEFLRFRCGENHFDFWAISASQLQAAGLAPEAVHRASTCTRCAEEFFSYRREKMTGRFGTVIALAPGQP